MTTIARKLRTESGLSWDTIARYAKSELLERGTEAPYEGRPVYMHHARCPNYCDFACNGNRGQLIAIDVDTLEGNFGDDDL